MLHTSTACAGIDVVDLHCGQVPDGQQNVQLAAWPDHDWHAHPAGIVIKHTITVLKIEV